MILNLCPGNRARYSKLVRTLLANDFTVEVELWYLPYGKKDDPGNAQRWLAQSKQMHIEQGGK